MATNAVSQSDAVQKEQEQLGAEVKNPASQGQAVSSGNTNAQLAKREEDTKTADGKKVSAPTQKSDVKAGEEKTQEQQAQDSKAEREAMQIPARRDEVVAPGDQTGAVSGATEGSEAENGGDSPAKPWADYVSKQEELWKKNTGQPIERNVDGRVKP